ncbi:MAG: DUF11 domain-containing protein [Anaerolineales bacterium]|nr:DUF11 domain-containing protein [Anaerolineales bacterium]
MSQMVYITKSLTLRGGYAADLTDWDPKTYITGLDAEGNGRVMYVTGDSAVTIEGFYLTGGDASFLGGDTRGDAGGGLFVESAIITISLNTIEGNTCTTAGDYWIDGLGGGVYLKNSNAQVFSNIIANNLAASGVDMVSGYGGGLYADGGGPVLRGNKIVENDAAIGGSFWPNGSGGGLYFVENSPILEANLIQENKISAGAGTGGGIEFAACPDFLLVNNIIADNHIEPGYGGSEIFVGRMSGVPSSGRLIHNTIARSESVADLSAIRVDWDGVITMVNTILSGHDVALLVEQDATAILTATLWHNHIDWTGTGEIVTGTSNFWGDPEYLHLAGGDYHIKANSPARDKGIQAGILTDIDGEIRDENPDLGADEAEMYSLELGKMASVKRVHPGDRITYTLAITNPGLLEVTNVVLTDDLPALQQPIETWSPCIIEDSGYGGQVVCPVGDLEPGEWATMTLAAQVSDMDPTELETTMRNWVSASGDQTKNEIFTDVILEKVVICWARVNGLEPDYFTIQEAVDTASSGDEIWIAGTCYGAISQFGGTQQVFVDKDLTLRGGYSKDFTEWDPEVYATILDAKGKGRVVVVMGPADVVIEGLNLTGGDASGQGGDPNSFGDAGGGLYAIDATVLISQTKIYGNLASTGFAVDGYGGGIGVYTTTLTLIDTSVHDNVGSEGGFSLGYGGGLAASGSKVRLESSRLENNFATLSATGFGGAAYIADSMFRANSVLFLNNSVSDEDWGWGGGLYLNGEKPFAIINSAFVGNRADAGGYGGSALTVDYADGLLLHPTLNGNTGSEAIALNYTSTLVISNAIIANQDLGFLIDEDSEATLNGVLWYNVNTNAVGALNESNAIVGDPAFAADGFHLNAGSAAIDEGLDWGLTTDVDGDSRIDSPDLGADEFRSCWVRLNDDSTDYTNVQAAIDDSTDELDVVKVAGTCTGVWGRPAPAGYDGSTTVTQTVYISKPLTIRGGYTPDDWNVSDPVANLTMLDAQGQGRVIFVGGDFSSGRPTIQGLHVTGGDATGQGGWSDAMGELDTGGGIFVLDEKAALQGNRIYSNTADDGGGIFLYNSDSMLHYNEVVSNTAQFGGGITLWDNIAHLYGNTIANNTASSGGAGIYLSLSNSVLSGNIIRDNAATNYGGGIAIWKSDPRFLNSVVVGNQAAEGSGLHLTASSPYMVHTTIAGNQGGCGIWVQDDQQGVYSSPVFTNTILVSHTVGISVEAGNQATLASVLLYGNSDDTAGDGTVDTSGEVIGDPRLLADLYHLALGSAAIDAGIELGVEFDIDGDLRPAGDGSDLGADETTGTITPDQSSEGLPDSDVIYTHVLTNTASSSQRFTLEAVSLNGYTVIVDPVDTGELEAFEEVVVTITVEIPADAISGTVDTAVVTATGSLVGQDEVTDITTVLFNQADPSLEPDHAGSGEPGVVMVYTHTLTNKANAPQGYSLAVDSCQNYTTTVEPLNTGELAPLTGSAIITVTVELPADAPVGIVDVTTITATGAINGEDSAIDTTTVKEGSWCIYLPLVLRGYSP